MPNGRGDKHPVFTKSLFTTGIVARFVARGCSSAVIPEINLTAIGFSQHVPDVDDDLSQQMDEMEDMESEVPEENDVDGEFI